MIDEWDRNSDNDIKKKKVRVLSDTLSDLLIVYILLLNIWGWR